MKNTLFIYVFIFISFPFMTNEILMGEISKNSVCLLYGKKSFLYKQYVIWQ